MIDARNHWEGIYRSKQPDEVSWYRPHLDVSLRMIEEAVPSRDAHIIDVGAGESTLVEDLLHRGYRNLHALDLSPTALEVAKARLPMDAKRIHWICGDVHSQPFERHRFDVWHDRAVFHFLTDPHDRAAYVRQVANAVKPGGHVIVAAFGPEGPTQCSGLDVVRYGPDALHDQFGTSFRLVEHRTELHRTPKGAIQQFTYCYCRTSPGEP
jgi:2-polyprenyl-3-methyl-5-hydroxy-6-metoxy-1,4-benzoquinol methylase